MEKLFTKGQKVTYFTKWNAAGDFTYQNAIVHSCGKKQMVLTSEETGQELGRHFRPNGMDSYMPAENFVLSGTKARMTDEEAAEFCNEQSLRYKRMELDRIATNRANGQYPDNDHWNTKLAELEAKLNAAPDCQKRSWKP